MKKLKPIHKYNSGHLATLCRRCRTIITNEFTDDLYCGDCDKYNPLKFKSKDMIKLSQKNKLIRREIQLLKRKKRLDKFQDDPNKKYSQRGYFKKNPHRLDHDFGCSCDLCRDGSYGFNRKTKHKKSLINDLLEEESSFEEELIREIDRNFKDQINN